MHYHLIGIGGTAMASLAGMLKARGHTVTGSDQNVYPPMSTMLADLNITVMQGYAPDHLAPAPDMVVIGNALSRGNVEVEAVLNARLPYQSQAETVKREFIKGKRSLVVAGTHGKTTTTSIAAHVLEVGGVHPGFLVGGVVQNFNSSFRVTDSDYFVIEGDEYDTAYFDKQSKFMHYLPELCIVGNIEYDHADIFPNLDAIKLSFRRLMNLVPQGGRLIAGWDDANVRDVVNSFDGKLHTSLETFGTSAECRWQARDVDFSGDGTRFRVTRDGALWSEIETPLIGEFNVRNCLAVIVAADAWGIAPREIGEGLRTFQNVKRRMQIRGRERGVTVIDDFAHHPTAVRATLEALRAKQREGRIVAVFEPRSATSRLKIFQADYARAFTAADVVIIADVFKSSDTANTTNELLDTAHLVRDITAGGKPAEMIAGVDDIVRHLTEILRPSDTVAIMSNGGFGGIHDKLLAALRETT